VARPAVSEPDPVLSQFREQVSETDRAILGAVNMRLELVAQIKAYKASRGIDFFDPERERSMLDDLARTNAGPLSAEAACPAGGRSRPRRSPCRICQPSRINWKALVSVRSRRPWRSSGSSTR